MAFSVSSVTIGTEFHRYKSSQATRLPTGVFRPVTVSTELLVILRMMNASTLMSLPPSGRVDVLARFMQRMHSSVRPAKGDEMRLNRHFQPCHKRGGGGGRANRP
jgi:hypothetical protein